MASVGVNNWYQFCMIETRASTPTSVAQVTSHRTISLLRQFRDDRVIRITCQTIVSLVNVRPISFPFLLAATSSFIIRNSQHLLLRGSFSTFCGGSAHKTFGQILITSRHIRLYMVLVSIFLGFKQSLKNIFTHRLAPSCYSSLTYIKNPPYMIRVTDSSHSAYL